MAGGISITSRNNDAADRYLSTRTLIELDSACEALKDLFAMHYAGYGLSRVKFNALIQLHMAGEGGLNQSELGKKLQVSRANITGLIERLEKEGLVSRRDDPADKRAFLVCLTDRAALLMKHFLPKHNDFVHQVMSVLDRREREQLISLLQKFNKGLELI